MGHRFGINMVDRCVGGWSLVDNQRRYCGNGAPRLRSWTKELAKELVMAEAAAQFNIHEAKTQLSRIVSRVEAGEEIVISRDGRPVAKVVRLDSSVRRSRRGSLRGKIAFADDWDSVETNEAIARDFGIA
jgi:prevent-host-death family protein